MTATMNAAAARKRPWTVILSFAEHGEVKQRVAAGGRKDALDAAVIKALAVRPDLKGLMTGHRIEAGGAPAAGAPR